MEDALVDLVCRLMASLCFISLAGCAGVAQTAREAPQAAKPIDASRLYAGVWHEIGRRPMSFTDRCVAGATEYGPKDDGEIDVTDSCRMDTPKGRLKTIGGAGQILDKGSNSKLQVRYTVYGVFPVVRQYWVLDRADDYSWFISSDPTFYHLWIYTRRPNVSPSERKRLVKRAALLGYDTKKLEFPAQPSGH
jgi:apolipoprotein D and lipocalin family protein